MVTSFATQLNLRVLHFVVGVLLQYPLIRGVWLQTRNYSGTDWAILLKLMGFYAPKEVLDGKVLTVPL